MSAFFQSGKNGVHKINKTKTPNRNIQAMYPNSRLKLQLNLNPTPKSKYEKGQKKSRKVSQKHYEKIGTRMVMAESDDRAEDFGESQIYYGSQEEQETAQISTNSQFPKGWTAEQWQVAKQFFSNTTFRLNRLERRSLAQQLEISEQMVDNGWKQYSKNQKYSQIKDYIAQDNRIQKQKEDQDQYLLEKLEDMIAKDGTLTIERMRKLIMDDLTKEKRFNPIPYVSKSRIQNLLKNAGYYRKKIAPSVDQKNNEENTARREQFCRYLQSLRANNIPIYFYHETELGKYFYKSQGWAREGGRVQTKSNVDKKVMLRCLLSPQGIASWQITNHSPSKAQIQTLIDKLASSDPGFSKDHRKFLMLDKRAICNRDDFCYTVQLNEFDIISMPVASIILNPIHRWFKRINNELRCEYITSREDLMKKSECLLLRFNKKSLDWYLQYFPQEIENCLPLK